MSRRYGNAQTIGSNHHQNTYFMTKQIKNCFLTVLADGTIDSVTGAYAAILACESVAKGFVYTDDMEAELERQFVRTAVLLNEKLYKGRHPCVSMLAACFCKDSMVYKGVGELSAAACDSRHMKVLEPGAGKIALNDKEVFFCSPGVWQALNEVEVEKLLTAHAHPFKKAQRLIEAVNSRQLKDQKSTVLLIVK